LNNILFQPPPGTVTELTAFSADGRWIVSNNVRYRNKRFETIGGWIAGGTLAAGTPRAIFSWANLAGTAMYAWGTTTKLYADFNGSTDITPASLPTSTGWSLQAYGENLMAAQAAGALYQYTGTGVATVISQAPAVITAMLVTNERQVLAFGCNEEVSTTFNSMCIRGSDLEDPTDWTTTASNNAFEHILEGSGKIITAFKIAGFIGVLTDRSLYMGTFLGDPAQTYRFEKVGDNCGCLGLKCVVVAGGVAYWMTNDYQIYHWTPGAVPQAVPCSVISYLQSTMNTNKSAAVVRRSFAFYNSRFNEVWFFFPTGSSSSANPSVYIALCLDDGSWFLGALNRSAMYQSELYLLGADSSGVTYSHERGYKGTAASPLTWSITSAPYYLDNANSRYMLREVWPDFIDNIGGNTQRGNVTCLITALAYPSGGGTGTQTVTFGTTTYKTSLRLSGRLISLKFSGDDASGASDTFARQGKLTFDAVKLGQR
jgi:hypothetical protein